MSAYWLLENVWAYSVQFGAVAGLALLLAWLGRRAEPSLRLALLQLGLLLALAAPFLMVKSGPMLEGVQLGAVEIAHEDGSAAPAPAVRPTAVILVALGGGVCLRLGWILIGLAALSWRRRRARPATADCSEFLELRAALGVRAELAAGRSGPVAFGVWRPTVLVPASLLDGDSAALRAVLAHELVHLRRRDWLFVVAEELVTAGLWFHPLAWLLVREIRLTREEVVDAQAAHQVSGAQPYLEALLAVARTRFEAIPSLGAEFLRERQVARRIATLVGKENTMSRTVQYPLAALCFLTLFSIAWWAAGRSPLVGAPQVAEGLRASDRVSVSQGSEGLILPRRREAPIYSMGALISGVEGDVTLELTLDDVGNVVDARAVSGPLALRQEAVRWALDWRYDPEVQTARVIVATLTFRLPERGSEITIPLLGLSETMRKYDLPPASLVLRSVQTADLDPADPALQAKLESYIGRSFAGGGALADAIQQDIVAATPASGSYRAARAYVAPRIDGAVLLVRRPTPTARKLEEPAAPATRSGPSSIPRRIRVGGETQVKRLTRQVRPDYPALARQAGVQGTVNLNIILTNEGAVRTVEVLSGHPLLIPAAVDAVKQWRYRPTLLNGRPVEVESTVRVNFTLSG